MEMKADYKQTAAGVIPEDWNVSKVDSEFDIRLGKMLDTEKNLGSPKPYLGNKAVQWGRIDVTDLPLMLMSPSDLDQFRLRKGDLLICEGGEVGRAAIWEAPISECYYQKALHRLRPLRGLNPQLMLYFLKYWSDHGMLSDYVSQTSIAHLTKEKLADIPVPIPPSVEQNAIVSALSDVDALIAEIQNLIVKKRDIKQSTGHKLLCSKENWIENRLDTVAEIRSGGTPSTNQAEFWDGDVPWCTPTDITALKGGKYLTRTSRTITSVGLKASSAELIPAHSVLMTSRATIGECAINSIPISTNQGFKNFIPFHNTDSEFLYYLLQTKKQQFISLCGGSTFLEISKAQLAAFKIAFPEKKTEQVQIATILADMDAELSALEERLGKTRQLKQGMMQELLTGRIRLK